MLKRKSIIGGLTVLALVMGAAFYGLYGIALGAGAGGGSNGGQDVQEPSYIGSISIPADASSQTLAGLAKITASDAEKAALAKFPGATVIKIELDDENGVLVYSVELQTASGIKDVKVDAGNAQILYVDTGGDNETAEHNALEAGETEHEGAEEADSD